MPDTITELRDLLSRTRPPTPTLGYPPEVRLRVGAFAQARHEQGQTWGQLATALGVSRSCVRNWAIRADKAAPRDEFVPIEVTATDAPSGSPLTLVSPAGFRLEGLDVDAAATLLGRLG